MLRLLFGRRVITPDRGIPTGNIRRLHFFAIAAKTEVHRIVGTDEVDVHIRFDLLFHTHAPEDTIDNATSKSVIHDILGGALSGGEDYELLFTVSQEDFPKIKANPNFTIIGHMTPENEGMYLVTRGNQKIELVAQGWNSLDKE